MPNWKEPDGSLLTVLDHPREVASAKSPKVADLLLLGFLYFMRAHTEQISVVHTAVPSTLILRDINELLARELYGLPTALGNRIHLLAEIPNEVYESRNQTIRLQEALCLIT